MWENNKVSSGMDATLHKIANRYTASSLFDLFLMVNRVKKSSGTANTTLVEG